MKERFFPQNEIVFREGDPGESFFQILEGKAGVYLHYGEAEERKLTEMLPGQYFGEMAVVEAWPRSTTVRAEEDLRVIEILESELNEYFEQQPDKILSIMKQIGGRIRTLTDEYNEVTAFLKEKQDAAVQKSSGFLARLKKYREISALAKKRRTGPSEEETVRLKDYYRTEKSPLPIAEYRAGTLIFRQGEVGGFMYAIQSGSVGIYTGYGTPNEKKLTTLFPHAFFGEMSLLDLETRSATAIAEEDGTTVEMIRPEELEALFRVNPQEVNSILCHLSNRLRRLTLDYEKACEAAAADA